MGNSSMFPENIKLIQNYDKQHWSSIQKQRNNYQLWQQKKSGVQYQAYLIDENWIQDEEQLQKLEFRQMYQNVLVTIHSIQKIQEKYLCEEKSQFYLLLQHIDYRLSQLKQQLSLEECLYVLLAAAQGYDTLNTFYGPLETNEEMICVNKKGKVKVWLNENYLKNQPSFSAHSLTKQSSQEGISYNLSQRQTNYCIVKLTETVQNKCKDRFPSEIKLQLIRSQNFYSFKTNIKQLYQNNSLLKFKNLFYRKYNSSKLKKNQLLVNNKVSNSDSNNCSLNDNFQQPKIKNLQQSMRTFSLNNPQKIPVRIESVNTSIKNIRNEISYQPSLLIKKHHPIQPYNILIQKKRSSKSILQQNISKDLLKTCANDNSNSSMKPINLTIICQENKLPPNSIKQNKTEKLQQNIRKVQTEEQRQDSQKLQQQSSQKSQQQSYKQKQKLKQQIIEQIIDQTNEMNDKKAIKVEDLFKSYVQMEQKMANSQKIKAIRQFNEKQSPLRSTFRDSLLENRRVMQSQRMTKNRELEETNINSNKEMQHKKIPFERKNDKFKIDERYEKYVLKKFNKSKSTMNDINCKNTEKIINGKNVSLLREQLKRQRKSHQISQNGSLRDCRSKKTIAKYQ